MLRQQGRLVEAETSLRSAVDVAREQGTRSWELRAATTLAGLLEEKGDAAGATAVLAPIHDWFDEGLDTPDLVDAATLRERLGGATVPSTPQEVT